MSNDTYQLIEVQHLRGGELVDLEGDEFAVCDDYECGGHCLDTVEYEHAIVDEPGVLETPGCMAVAFSNVGLWIGFPPDHKVKVLVDTASEM